MASPQAGGPEGRHRCSLSRAVVAFPPLTQQAATVPALSGLDGRGGGGRVPAADAAGYNYAGPWRALSGGPIRRSVSVITD